VALAWVRDRPGVVAPVVGRADVGAAAGVAGRRGVELPPEIRRALDDVSAPALGYPEASPRWQSDDLED
jgi:aryl-alcohol dehydrogenase-like predicted oxidoreductase